MKHPFAASACALAVSVAMGNLQAQTTTPAATPEPATAPAPADTSPVTPAGNAIVITGKRSSRVSKGATNLPLAIKETPQSISTIEREEITDHGLTGSNDALRLATGITVDEWETNRTNFSARGFDIMLTQVDGLGMTNDWGLTVGQLDTFLFERIELVRGANGLLTGVGNASGTINYERKRPTNQNATQAVLSGGSHNAARVALDANRVLTEDGAWAGRVVVAVEDKDSYLRALHNQRGTVYGVVDGQIGDNGVLTLGFTHQDDQQQSPMWGSLTLRYADGSQADFPRSSSTAQDWTRWNTRATSAFAEYAHTLSADWSAKLTYNHRRGSEDTKLFYAYSLTGTLNPDNTGLLGWLYRSDSTSSSQIVDANLSGRFGAFGRQLDVVLGLSHSQQENRTLSYSVVGPASPVLPAFPYAGDAVPEPTWGPAPVASDGDQQLTRLYAATRLQLADGLHGIAGLNAIRLRRDGTSIYGGGVALTDETTEKASPYVGLTWDITPQVLAYASYSDIFQAQDQRNAANQFLAPMRGVNAELGVKAEWLDRRLLSTLALFSAEQKGLATEAGFDPVAQQSWYEPQDVRSRGFELETSGRIGAHGKLTAGYTQLRLTGPDGQDIYAWVPRRTFKLRADTRVLPRLRLGGALRWQSDIAKTGGARQDAYLLASAFVGWELADTATLRLNVDNLTDKKYLKTVQFGAIYGAPRSGTLTLDLRF